MNECPHMFSLSLHWRRGVKEEVPVFDKRPPVIYWALSMCHTKLVVSLADQVGSIIVPT